ARIAEHAERVPAFPDVAVAEHGDTQPRLQLRDRAPVGGAGVELCGGARVEADGRRARVLGDAARVAQGEEMVVDAGPHLHRDRHAARAPNGGGDDASEQTRPERNGGAAALTRDLRRRTAEVEVEVIDALVGEEPGRIADDGRITAVELHRSWLLADGAARQEPRARVALEEPARGDHLRDVEPGAE